MKKIIILFFLYLFMINIFAVKPDKIVLSHEDKNAYPWVLPVESGYVGVDLIILDMVAEKLNVKIEYEAFPWQRCLVEMQNGNVDGAFASSYKQDREIYGKYPTENDVLDESKKIHVSGYSLYLWKNSSIDFNGQFINLDGKIGAQRDFSIVPLLKNLGVEVDDSTIDPVNILKKLEAFRIGAAAIQTARADNILQNNSELGKNIAKHPTEIAPFDQKPYFVMLSHQFIEKYPDFSLLFWDTLEEVVNSEECSKAIGEFYEKY